MHTLGAFVHGPNVEIMFGSTTFAPNTIARIKSIFIRTFYTYIVPSRLVCMEFQFLHITTHTHTHVHVYIELLNFSFATQVC